MKTSKISLIVVAGLVLLSSAAFLDGQQPVPASVATGFNAIREDTLRADLTFVASDALEGRMSLENGDEVTIQWIASEFAKAGLAPARRAASCSRLSSSNTASTANTATLRSSAAEAIRNGNFPKRLALTVLMLM